MSYEMNDLLELVVDQNASDLALPGRAATHVAHQREHGPDRGTRISIPDDTEKLVLSIAPDNHIQNLKLNGGSDFGFAYMDRARFRVSILKAKGSYGLVLRQIPNRMFGLRDIGLPDRIKELLYRRAA
jgi:twitching motility protein PilT